MAIEYNRTYHEALPDPYTYPYDVIKVRLIKARRSVLDAPPPTAPEVDLEFVIFERASTGGGQLAWVPSSEK